MASGSHRAVCVCVCVCVYVCVRVCLCVCVCMYACMYACVHVYSESPDDVLKRDATHDGRMPCGQESMGRQVSTARQAAMEHPEPTAAQEPAAPPVRWARLVREAAAVPTARMAAMACSVPAITVRPPS